MAGDGVMEFDNWIIMDALKRNACVKMPEFPDELTCVVFGGTENALEWRVYVPKGRECHECKERKGHYLDAETIQRQQERIAKLTVERDAYFEMVKRVQADCDARDALVRDLLAVYFEDIECNLGDCRDCSHRDWPNPCEGWLLFDRAEQAGIEVGEMSEGGEDMTNGAASETNGITRGTNGDGLLSCPLCGGEATIRKSIWFYVQCTSCPLELGASYDGDGNPDGEYWTEGDAVAAWNRRAAEAELAELAHSAWSMAMCAMQGMPIPAKWGEHVESGLREHGIDVDDVKVAFEEDEDER